MFAKVIIDIASSQVDKVFDYAVGDSGAGVGFRVLVPFGKRFIEGFVIELCETTNFDESLVKPIVKILDEDAVVTEEQLFIAKVLKEKYHVGFADSFRLFLPASFRNGKVKTLFEYKIVLENEVLAKEQLAKCRANAKNMIGLLNFLLENGSEKQSKLNAKFGNSSVSKLVSLGVVKKVEEQKQRKPYATMEVGEQKPVELTATQNKVLDAICESVDKKFLLHGVTGSGKTEVYMNVIERTLQKNKTAIMLVPEISLTPQVMLNFKRRFGETIAVLHSGLGIGERFDEWKRILCGDAKIVVGARSALFAPIKNLGVIIVDEEHDTSYISDSNPRYSTIEIAKAFADKFDCKLVLGSATPSLETYHLAVEGKYRLLEMKERINKRNLPPIKLVDMKDEILMGNNQVFSRELEMALTECVKKGNQAIIFINRRGYSSYIMCKDCGWRAVCPSCDVSLVYHKAENVLKCHYCDKRFTVPAVCPECGSKYIKQGSTGTQKVVDEILKFLPNAKILRMDNDTTSTKNSHEKILSEFRAKKAQILVGTQMIVKGHDFPDVTLVGIIDADLSLHQSSYQATEKTFQLITQVAGRAGRADKQGEIILQTYMPRHYVYRLASVYDYLGFYSKEINLRETTKFPPFSKILRVLISSENEELAKNFTTEYARSVKNYSDERKSLLGSNDFYYIGAMRSPLKKINDKFRYQVILRIKTEVEQEITSKVFALLDEKKNKNVLAFVEINPSNLS